MIDAIKPIRGPTGRPRKRPKRLLADCGYDHDTSRRELWKRGIKPVIGRRATEHGSGLGQQRWIVEAAVNFLHQFRRLRIRWERDPGMHTAFLLLACSLICWRRLRSA